MEDTSRAAPTRRRVLSSLASLGVLSLTGCTSDQPTTTPSDGPRRTTGRPVEGRTDTRQPIGTDPGQPTVTDHEEYPTLPAFTDPYVGFSVGRPVGWLIRYSDGIVWLWPADQPGATTLAFVYPGWLRNDATLQSVGQAVVRGLDAMLAASGGGIELEVAGELSGSVDGTPIRGAIATRLLGRSDGAHAVVWGGWAPDSDWQERRETVMAVGSQYGQFTPAPLTVYRHPVRDLNGQYAEWEYVVPGDWTVRSVSTQGIDINAPGGHVAVGYASVPQAYDAWEILQLEIDLIQGTSAWQLRETGAQRDLGSHTDGQGNRWQMAALEYLADWQGQPYTGVMTAASNVHENPYVYPPRAETTFMVWQREAVPELWDRYAAITEVIQANTRVVNFRLGHLLSPGIGDTTVSDVIDEVYRASDAVHSYTAQGFSDAIMNNDRVVHPDDPSLQIVVPAASSPPGACPAGYILAPDPLGASPGERCMPLVTGP